MQKIIKIVCWEIAHMIHLKMKVIL